jgi:hypothetical protein
MITFVNYFFDLVNYLLFDFDYLMSMNLYYINSLYKLGIDPSSKQIIKYNNIKGGNMRLQSSNIQSIRFKDVDCLFSELSNFINTLKFGIVYSFGLGVKYTNYGYKSLGEHLLVTRLVNLEALVTYYEGLFLIGLEEYNSDLEYESNEIEYICIQYKEISILETDYKAISKKAQFISRINEIKSKLLHDRLNNYTISNLTASNHLNIWDSGSKYLLKYSKFIKLIPFSCDLKDYGLLINSHYVYDDHIGKLYKYDHNIEIFLYDITFTSYKAIVLKNKLEYFRYEDSNIININNSFIRKLNKLFIHYKDGIIKYVDKWIHCKSLSNLKRDWYRDDKYLTFDIEAYIKNEEYIPYACAIYKGNIQNKFTYYDYKVTDFNSWEEMLNKCLEDIFKLFPKHTVYVHNLGGFDSLYLIKSLYKISEVNTLFRDNKLISIKCRVLNSDKNSKNKYNTVIFKDSYALLPLSLDDLIKSLNISTKKLNFPYLFVNESNLNYKGKLPDIHYFNKVSLDEYQKLVTEVENEWDLLKETSKYMFNDVKSLYEIIDLISKATYKTERINITKAVSISSLALRIYLTNYMNVDNLVIENISNNNYTHDKSNIIKSQVSYNLDKPKYKYQNIGNNNISNINRNVILNPTYDHYKWLRMSYYGGRVDVFQKYGENLYWYDVNSLFSYSMKMDMPGLNMYKSNDNNLDNYFGICYASVEVPDNIEIPILPYKDKNGINYYPTGKWTGWYTSVLLQKASEMGIKINVHGGYKFDKIKGLFNNYVDHNYNLKLESKINGNKGLYQLSKLMLNSLYGRFGLKYNNAITKFVNEEESKEIHLKYRVLQNHSINNLEYIKYLPEPSSHLYELDKDLYNQLQNTTYEDLSLRSVMISSFTTSYANIFMHDFLNFSGNKCFYTDTDSLFLQFPLDNKYVGNNIGQFKFEGLVKEAYFISSKLYCLVMDNGEIKIKSKGVNSSKLNKEDFVKLISDNDININDVRFKTSWENFAVLFKNISITLRSNNNKRYFTSLSDSKPLKVINDSIYRPYDLAIVKYNKIN